MEYLDLENVKSEKVNPLIKEKLKQHKTITLQHVNSMHNICAGLSGECEVIIEDSTGLYTGSYMEGPRIVVKGNVGWYAGDDMMAGQLIIEKNTGCNVGAYICGGDIVIYGNTGSRVGYGMKGGNIVVAGSAGRWAAQMAMGGNLIVLGEMGSEIGESMYAGKIFTRDKNAAEKMGRNVFYDEITDEEASQLTALFETYGLEACASQFHVIRPALSGRHKYVLFQPELKPELAKKYLNRKG
ncbi:GltB/FmdC/FwdC-like GXGXG domain-containing protein [Anaeromicropila populeti]|uniref:GXGXG motif-containing protein n=1 Tax=Anaeromicropila populeti TaxID=37658 RepID=A0A1I6KYF3_9FIRM|nr:glutamate synthase [Anaeromicropila populeti]SFR96249.1 GXGXG motif-containing protein [Anaeromicropila populeti]